MIAKVAYLGITAEGTEVHRGIFVHTQRTSVPSVVRKIKNHE
jgi:hypothetical protein